MTTTADASLGELADLAVALGLAAPDGSFNSDWLTRPGDFLGSILANDDQRRALLDFVAHILDSGPLATDAPGQPKPPVGRIIPGAAANVFTAQGLGGQTVLVDPGSQTVVVRIGQFTPGGADQYGARDAARFVTEALVRR